VTNVSHPRRQVRWYATVAMGLRRVAAPRRSRCSQHARYQFVAQNRR
jgi:hypothetical protein